MPVTTPAADPLARQLLGALLTSLLLLLPLRAAIATTTYAGLWLCVFLGVAVTVGFGLLLRWAGVPAGLPLSVATAGCFALGSLVALEVVALLGDPGDDTAVALVAGLTAAAVVTPLAALGINSAGTATTGAAAVLCSGGMVLAIAIGPTVWQQVDDARDDAEAIAAFEDAGLVPLLPDLGDLEGEYEGRSLADGRPTGYNLLFHPDGNASFDAAHLEVSVSVEPTQPCIEVPGSVTCREADGYVVTERDGEPEQVTATAGSITLTATYRDGEGDLPDPDDVGAALLASDDVEWDDVLGLGG